MNEFWSIALNIGAFIGLFLLVAVTIYTVWKVLFSHD